MKPLGQFDRDYADRMTKAMTGAMVEVAHDKATNVALLRNGEIYDALLTIMASILATSKETDTPRGVRLMAEAMAKDLAKRIARCREELFARGVLDREGTNPRQEFMRLKNWLSAKVHIAEREALVWPV